MSDFPPCPECASEYTYSDGILMNCPTCGHAWSTDAPDASADTASAQEEGLVVRDSVGNILQDGDDLVITQTLRVKGAQNAKGLGDDQIIPVLQNVADGDDLVITQTLRVKLQQNAL